MGITKVLGKGLSRNLGPGEIVGQGVGIVDGLLFFHRSPRNARRGYYPIKKKRRVKDMALIVRNIVAFLTPAVVFVVQIVS